MTTPDSQSPRIAVMGAGSWGTVFCAVLAVSGAQVRLWARRAEAARTINETHANSVYVPDLMLPDSVAATSDPSEALEDVDGIVLAVPAQSLRENLEAWPPFPDVPVVSLIKGIERGSDLRMSEILATVGGIAPSRIAVLSGPNLAREIALQQPCASVVASESRETASVVAQWCRAPWLRTYVSDDVIGVEIAGAMKNVIATAVGAAAGLGFGDNSRASLITRGLAEITRLGVARGAQPQTFAGLAGMGDLVATCTSSLSRNFRLGYALGEGLSVDEAKATVGQTAEGVATARAIAELGAGLDLDLPITQSLVDVIDHGRDISSVTRELLARSVRPE